MSVQLVPLVLRFCVVAATAVAWARLRDLRVEGLGRVLPAAVTGLLLGWVTVAAAVNAGRAGVALGASASGTTAQVWAVVVLAVVGPPATVVVAALAAASAVAVALVVRTLVRRDPVTLLVG